MTQQLGTGIFWSHLHSHVWRLTLAISWNLNQSSHMGPLHAASQGFLTEWPAQSSHSKCPDQQNERFITIFQSSCESHTASIGYKQVASPPRFKERRYGLHLLMGVVSKNVQSFSNYHTYNLIP